MRTDVKNIAKRFIDLELRVRRELNKRDCFLSILEFVRLYLKRVVPDTLVDQIERDHPSSCDDLFKILGNHWNFLECDLLVKIVDRCGKKKKKLQKEVKEYEKYLKEFIEKRKLSEVSKCLTLSNSDDKTKEKVVMKLNLSDPTLREIKELKSKICEILEIMPSTLMIHDIKKGCIEVTFLMPVELATCIFDKPFTVAQREALKNVSVINLTCRDKTEIIVS